MLGQLSVPPTHHLDEHDEIGDEGHDVDEACERRRSLWPELAKKDDEVEHDKDDQYSAGNSHDCDSELALRGLQCALNWFRVSINDVSVPTIASARNARSW